VVGDIARDQRRADLFRGEGRLLLVDRADARALLVAQHRERRGAGNVVFRVLRGRARIQHGVEALQPGNVDAR